MKKVSVICRVMGKSHEEKYGSLHEAKTEGTSATHIIDWDTGRVWYPEIIDNTFNGDWHLANPKLTANSICWGERDGFNPLKYDYAKIRRRIEDALRKTSSEQDLIEIANTLGCKIN